MSQNFPMEASSLYRFTGTKSRSMVDSMLELLDHISRGTTPKQDKASSFVTKVFEKLPMLARFNRDGDGEENDLVGKEAVEARLQHVVEKSKECALNFQDLHRIHGFAWLLSDESKATLEEPMPENSCSWPVFV
jgi:hypothetical protein